MRFKGTEEMPMPVLLPSQFADRYRKGHDERDGVRRLMTAVLEDAIRCLCGRAFTEAHETPGRKARMAREARAWFEEQDSEALFGFGSVCAVLGADPVRLRERVFAMGLEAMKTLPRRRVDTPQNCSEANPQEAN